jgi:hypothetical protein
MSETLGQLIPLNSCCTTTDRNEAENFEKNTNNFDNEVDQSCDELMYMSAAETELILQDITNIAEIENRQLRKCPNITSLIVVEIYIAVFENKRRFFIPCTVNFIVNFFLDNSTALGSVFNFRYICNVLQNQFCFSC